MAKIEVQLEKSDVIRQGDIVIINWEEGEQSSYIVFCYAEKGRSPRITLCGLDGGCSLLGFTDLGNITSRQLQLKIGLRNKVSIIKKENLHMIIKDIRG